MSNFDGRDNNNRSNANFGIRKQTLLSCVVFINCTRNLISVQKILSAKKMFLDRKHLQIS